MCGIAGFVGKGSEHELKSMTRALSHRGPDDEGLLLRGEVGLGHRRLSIIDTSARGHQPMMLAGDDVAIVFNGEIYNFQILRAQLKEQGRMLVSDSDTEVLLHLYAMHGEDFLNDTIGMFALALYDFKKGKLILARDRMGEKPLYWSLQSGVLRFASELRVVMVSDLRRELDHDSLACYLQFDYVPTPRTILKDVYKLEPGTMLMYENGRTSKRAFWKSPASTRAIGEQDACYELDRLLGASVSRQLVSDVPLGVFLSGGLDSSTIAYYATKASSRQINTFSIGFDDPSFDESRFARIAAEHIGTKHHELLMHERDALDLVQSIPNVFSEPVADASVLPTLFLSRFARQSVTVALGGDGGDELFAGYPTFQADTLFRLYRHAPDVFKNLLQRGANALPASHANFSLSYNLKKFVSSADMNPLRRHLEWLGTFAQSERAELLQKAPLSDMFESADHFAEEFGGSRENQLLYLYMRTYLMDQVLVKVDRASMYYGLETRAPFLDHTLVDLMLSLPYPMKYRRGEVKHLLKRLMRDKLPAVIIDRKKKGFGMPLARWLAGPLKPLCQELLSETAIKKQGIFKSVSIERLKDEHFDMRQDNRKELWNLMVFQMWYEKWLT